MAMASDLRVGTADARVWNIAVTGKARSAIRRASRLAPRCPPSSGTTAEPSSATATTGGSARLSDRSGATARIRMRVRNLKLAQLFPTVEQAKGSLGDVDGLIELDGRGNSVARMLGASSGKVGLFIDDGRISQFLMELAALDLWDVAKLALQGDEPVRIRCAIADFAVKNGKMEANALVFDTEVVNVSGKGSVDLKSEEMDLTLKPEPKDKSIASLNSPLHLRGTFAKPDVGPDTAQIAAKGAGAILMGIINPLLAVIPLLEEGGGEDSNCRKLIAQAAAPKKKKHLWTTSRQSWLC